MLQAHSLIWHYLWLAPHILQLALAVYVWRQGLHRLFPIFFAYLIFEALEEFILYGLDLSPSVSSKGFWGTYFIGRIAEGLLKIALIGELFGNLVGRWRTLASFGNRLIRSLGAVLVVLAVVAAAYVPVDNPQFAIVSRAHLLEQTFYIVQSGLIVFLFLFAAHFNLDWDNRSFGIAVGFALVVCEHLATWAVMASGALMDKRYLLDFLNMATYHVAVLIWFYYLLPRKTTTMSAVSLPENNLAIWNRELERLLQQ
jgi:hypothetical protein